MKSVLLGSTFLAMALSAGLVQSDQPPKTVGERDDLLARANASVKAAAARVKDDPTRPTYHVLPPANWLNDPNGPLFYDGSYHLFYQQNPYGDQWGNMHWGHVRSKDLAHWEQLPIALWPSKSRGEDHVFSGCAAVTKKRQIMLFYTSIGKRMPEQWAAIPEDEQLIRWKKHPANPLLTEKLHGDVKIHDWRDPFIFEHDQHTYMVLGGNLNERRGGEAVVTIYRAENEGLTQWKYLGILYQHPDPTAPNIECPNFFKLGGKWVLIVSTHGPVDYFVGDLDEKAMKFRAEHWGVMDYGDHYYAPNCMEDDKGRRILWGWVRGFKPGRGWNGCLTLPRVLTLGPDGHLIQQPAPELQKLRGTPFPRTADLRLTDSAWVLEGVRGDTMEILAAFEPGDAKSYGLKVRRSRDGKLAVSISYDGKQLDVAGAKMPLTLSPEQRTLQLHLFLDRSVLEVYTNTGVCVSQVMYPDTDHLGVEIFARGGQVTLKSLDSWPLNSIWAEDRR